MSILASVLIGIASIGGLVLKIAGALIARRAWRRYGWDELRLVYRVFLWGLILIVLSSAALPLVGLIASYGGSFAPTRVASSLFGIATGLPTVMVAVGMYRLARRGAEVR